MKHILGTDESGRDIFSRITGGARVSLAIGFFSVVISLFVGVAIGCAAGYCGGFIDIAAMRFVETCLSFPNFFLVMVIIALTSPAPEVIILVIGLTGWFKVAILTRNKFRSLKEREFITAVRVLGASDLKIVFKYLLPNISPHILVAATYGVGNAILIECSLSYLGVGIQEPLSSLGNMLYRGKNFILRGEAFWISLYPGLTILLILLAYNFLGDGLARILTPFSGEEEITEEN